MVACSRVCMGRGLGGFVVGSVGRGGKRRMGSGGWLAALSGVSGYGRVHFVRGVAEGARLLGRGGWCLRGGTGGGGLRLCRGFLEAVGFAHGTLPRTALKDVGCAWVCLGRGGEGRWRLGLVAFRWLAGGAERRHRPRSCALCARSSGRCKVLGQSSWCLRGGTGGGGLRWCWGFLEAVGFVHGTLPRTALRDVGCA